MIADYADVITRGAGFVAGEVCSVLVGEDGFPNPVGMLCSQSVQSAVSQALAGNSALTNHGLWVAVYSPSNIHFGSW